MKKIFKAIGLIAMGVLLFTPPAFANPYTLYLASSSATVDSGNTTVANSTSAVSWFYVAGGGIDRSKAKTLIPLQDSAGPYWVAQIESIAIQQVSTGASALVTGVTDNSSGTTFEFGYAVSHEGSLIGSAEKIPIAIMALNSSTTPQQLTFITPATGNIAFYFKSSGITPYNDAQIKVKNISGTGWRVSGPVLILEDTFTMNTSSAGVSQFALSGTSEGSIANWPDGVDRAYFQVAGGTSAYYTLDESVPTAGTAAFLYKGSKPLGIKGNIAKAITWVRGVGDTTIRYWLYGNCE